MKAIDLKELAGTLSAAWQSTVIGTAGGANIKVLRMDSAPRPNDVHNYAEALVIVEGRLNLELDGMLLAVGPGGIFIVPAGLSHAVAAGCYGTLLIVDAVEVAE